MNYLELHSFKDKSQTFWDEQMNFILPTTQGHSLTKIICRNPVDFW